MTVFLVWQQSYPVDKSQSRQTPEVWYTLTDNQEVNRIKKVRALFKSASPTRGVKLFEYQIQNPISTRDEISRDLNIPKQTLDTLLKYLKRYNLVKNIPYVCWYSPILIPEGAVKLYQTVKTGIDGFKIDNLLWPHQHALGF